MERHLINLSEIPNTSSTGDQPRLLHVVKRLLCVTPNMAESLDLLRFETDLEFLQSLANPQYLNCMLYRVFV